MHTRTNMRMQVAEYASAHLSRNLEVELSNMGSLSGTDQVGKETNELGG